MDTTPIDDPDATCQIERVDDANTTYLCSSPARHIWYADPSIPVFVCKSCKRWLETLEELGLKL